MDIKLTVKYKALEDGRFFGQVVEIPEILSEAASIDELKENMNEAISMYLEYRRSSHSEDEANQAHFEELELN